MYAAKRPLMRPIIFLLILVVLALAACSGRGTTSNWPGMSAEGDTVYVAYGKEVLAYDTASQAVVWTYPVDGERGLQYYAAPSVLDGRVVIGDYGKASSMINPKQIVSIYGLSDPPGSPSDWINSETAEDKIIAPPLQVGDRAFVAVGLEVLALDATNGDSLWAVPFMAENPIWGPMAFADGTVYAASMDGNVYAIDAETGTEDGRWTTDTSFPGGLTLDGDNIYAGGYDNKLHAFDRTSFGAEHWNIDTDAGIWGAPAVLDGRVFFGDMDGNVYAVDAESGDLIWQTEGAGPIVTSPAISDGVVYVASEGDPEDRANPQWHMTAFNAEDGTQLWQQSPPTGIYTTPVVIGDSVIGVLFGNADELLVAYDKNSGVEQWTYTPAAE